jgi:hypothetical protein
MPRKSSARRKPVLPPQLDSSDSSSSDDGEAPQLELESEDESPAKVTVPMQRDKTVTLPDEYEVEKILSGPRADGKYRVKWVGFSMKECTWEPEQNLTPACFDEYNNNRDSSDESGDDQPIHKSIPRKKKTTPPKPKTAAPEQANPPDYDECLRQYVEEADNVRLQKIADVQKARRPPRRVHRIIPVVATRTTFDSQRGGLRRRTGVAQIEKFPKRK